MDVKSLALYPQNFGLVTLLFSSLSNSQNISNQIGKQFQREQVSALRRASRFSLFSCVICTALFKASSMYRREQALGLSSSILLPLARKWDLM